MTISTNQQVLLNIKIHELNLLQILQKDIRVVKRKGTKAKSTPVIITKIRQNVTTQLAGIYFYSECMYFYTLNI